MEHLFIRDIVLCIMGKILKAFGMVPAPKETWLFKTISVHKNEYMKYCFRSLKQFNIRTVKHIITCQKNSINFKYHMNLEKS